MTGSKQSTETKSSPAVYGVAALALIIYLMNVQFLYRYWNPNNFKLITDWKAFDNSGIAQLVLKALPFSAVIMYLICRRGRKFIVFGIIAFIILLGLPLAIMYRNAGFHL